MKSKEKELTKKSSAKYRKDLSSHKKILRAAENKEVILSKKLIFALRPWNTLMLRELNQRIDEVPLFEKIISEFLGRKLSGNALLRIYQKSIIFNRLAENRYEKKKVVDKKKDRE